MPFHEGPVPKEVARFDVGNVAVFVFPAAGFRKNEYVLRVGRWKVGGKQFYSSEFIPLADLDDLLQAVAMAEEELSRFRLTRAKRR